MDRIHTHTHTHTHTRTYTHTYTYAHTHTHTCTEKSLMSASPVVKTGTEYEGRDVGGQRGPCSSNTSLQLSP